MKEVVLVTGGTGNIGTAFVARLAKDARGPEIRVATRDPSTPICRLLSAMNPETVRLVALDEKAFAGATKLFVIAPFVADIGAWHEPIAKMAKASKTIIHIVKASVTGARGSGDPPPGKIPLSHWQGEEHLRKTGIPTTAIRPTIYMQHFLTVPAMYTAGEDEFHLPTGDANVAWLDCRDIATFAAAILFAPDGHDGKAYELSGPESIRAKDIAQMLSWVSGRAVAHVDGEDAFVARCQALGANDAVKFVYREAAGGWFGKVEKEDYERITKNRPTSFAEFALDHSSVFSPS